MSDIDMTKKAIKEERDRRMKEKVEYPPVVDKIDALIKEMQR